ncbi:Sensor kinase protein RcsC [Raoultella terrigena]|uniref:Sensor kinase protein RcsC n=1 Tax=Raoultella terrigena TaxID=577 RepID=A0A4U9D077_RAOTE|nr:Sensor kinase protein RcsC [Raoultella terrigena]
MQERIWFGYTSGFRELAMKKSLPPSSLSIVYSVSVRPGPRAHPDADPPMR